MAGNKPGWFSKLLGKTEECTVPCIVEVPEDEATPAGNESSGGCAATSACGSAAQPTTTCDAAERVEGASRPA